MSRSGRPTSLSPSFMMVSVMRRLTPVAVNARFYNADQNLYAANGGAGGTTGATQVAQALALDADLAPEEDREAILDYLVENMYAFQSDDGHPHFSGGTIGLAPTIRALTEGGRDDVIWDALRLDTQSSYGFSCSRPIPTFDLTVEIPANTIAEVWVPKLYKNTVSTPKRAEFLRNEDGYEVYRVGPGVYPFANAGPAA